jgi:thioredoxin-dependent peroxiredoxin
LSEHRGEIVVLLFYPGDETPVCTKQFCSYRDTGLEGLGATVVGISAQDLESHQRFTTHHGLTVPLLADADKKVARAYGVSIPVVGTRRAVFAIDEQGVVRFKHVHMLGLDYLDADELRAAVAKVASPATA